MLPPISALGNFSQAFLKSAQGFSVKELCGILFLIFAVSFYYGHFINTLPTSAD